jgi:hypothetical protein
MMRELASWVLNESSGRSGGSTPDAAVVLLYERLSPVIGSGGFGALMRRATRAVAEKHSALEGMDDGESFEANLEELRNRLGNGTDDPDIVVAELVDELVGTLERMIGTDLTARLLAAGNLNEAGRHG